jgi:iron-sulfur cluster assembly protein
MINLTDKAVVELKRIIADQGFDPETPVRMGVKGGGCSGFSYAMTFDPTASTETDEIIEGEVRVAIDRKSIIYLEGMTIDFHEDLMQRGFVFENPNASSTCGCGTSFSV